MSDFPQRAAARELTPEEREAQGKEAYKHQGLYIAARERGQEAWWAMAEQVFWLDENQAWLALGYDGRREWLAQPEMMTSESAWKQMYDAYYSFRVLRKVDPKRLTAINHTNLRIVLPALKAGSVLLDKALDDAKALGPQDLREEYFGQKDTRVSPDSVHGDGEDESEDAAIEGTATDLSEPTPASAVDGTGGIERAPLEEVRAELAQAVASGQENPRVPAAVAALVLDRISGNGPIDVGADDSVEAALQAWDAAIARPQREAGARQAVRKAGQRLADLVRSLG
jgi:hypothetical protein